MHNRIIKKFTEHPHSVGETYWQHFKFAMFISLHSIVISTFAFFHALFPFLFVSAASDRLEKVYQAIQVRRTHEKKSVSSSCCQ